ARSTLLPMVIGHLKRNMYYRRHLDLTANTVGDLLSCIFTVKQTADVTEEVTKIIQGLFDRTVRTLLVIDDDQRDIAGSLLVSSLTEMLRLMDESHYKKLMNGYPKQKPLRRRLSIAVNPDMQSAAACKDFLLRVLVVFQDLIRRDDFPQDWTTMRLITNNVMLTAIQYIADDLTGNFNGADFDRELWDNFFLLAVDFITQPALQLEDYSEAKSSQIKDRYNDMRVPVGFHIQSLWNHLGPNKESMMLDMIGPFLKVTMIPQAELRKATIPIFFDIIECEFQIKNHLRRVEGRMIQELDSLVIDHHGDAEYKNLFCKVLLDKVQAEPQLQEEGKRFVFSVTDLLERLLDYRETMDREEQRDTKMHCTFNILNFYKDSRRDMYIRYISRLYELHLQASNFVEAGLTLRLYAQLLSWSSAALPAEMSYPSQTEAKRKEELFNRILDCFDKGKAWEYGLPLCKELAEHYEKTFQYRKLGQILQKQASFLDRILDGQKLRQDPSYYRVAYYGNTFPPYVKNKAFIYRGDECLQLSTLMDQLTTEYPTATILTSNQPPDESVKRGDTQYIQIVSVKPVSGVRQEFVGREVPSEISAFYQTNEVDTFKFDLPYCRGVKDKNNEFKTLCMERTVMTCTYKLPGILRWYEVASSVVMHLCPVQAALETVQMMNNELKSSAANAATDPDQCLRHLSMRLQGVINSVVNGGISKYQEAFFNDSYISQYPNEKQYIEQLKQAIMDLLDLLNNGLTLQGKLAGPELLPLHKNLLEIYNKMRSTMGYHVPKNRYSTISCESQRPSTPSSQSFNSSGSNRSSIVSGADVNVTDEGEDNIYIEAPERAVPVYPTSGSSADLTQNSEDDLLEAPPPPPPRKKSIGGGSLLPDPTSPLPPVPVTPTPPPIPVRKQSSKDGSERMANTVNWADRVSVKPPLSPRTNGDDASTGVMDVPPLPSKRATMTPTVRKELAANISAMTSTTNNSTNNCTVSRSASIGGNGSTSSQNVPSPQSLSPPPVPQAPIRSISPGRMASSPGLSSDTQLPPPVTPRNPPVKPKPSFMQLHTNTAPAPPRRESPKLSEGGINARPPPPPLHSSSGPAVNNYARPPPPSPKLPKSSESEAYSIPPPPLPNNERNFTPSTVESTTNDAVPSSANPPPLPRRKQSLTPKP
ncbi:dedicator of cytokinesis protein 3-like, partial [Plakobranchus ocellatus]